MNIHIQNLLQMTLSGEMAVSPVSTTFDRLDYLLPQMEMESKRLAEYILAQEPKLTPDSSFTGFFAFNGSVVGDAFNRSGHRFTGEGMGQFYLKPIDNLSTMEWQHATADYRKVLQKGIRGLLCEIDTSLAVHDKPEEIEFLQALRRVGEAMIGWAKKCANRTAAYAKTFTDPETVTRLNRLADALIRVPELAPTNFYEAVLCIYVCFSADPDSFGTLDRYLSPFYEKDMAEGKLTYDEAKAYLQELFLMVQAVTPVNSPNFTKGGQSHFCVGGYLPDGTDGFSATSRLIIDAMTELPTYIPEVTLRWTKKLSHEDFAWVMDKERQDPHKRIAFTNDEKRIQCYHDLCGFPYDRAVNYTLVGCNEPAFLGAITGSNSKGNVLRCVETLFHEKADLLLSCTTFDQFYAVFEGELFADLEKIYYYDDRYNAMRARDVNYISSLFFNDCIENAKSLTQGGGDVVICAPMLMGIPNVIDSLSVVRQFVYEDKLVTMAELVQAVQQNWVGHETLHTLIEKKAPFYGNDDEISNAVSRRLYDSFYGYLKDKRNLFGYPYLISDSLGYNEHHKWFGEHTKATPDGRHDGENLKFGLGQSGGHDRNGLTAYLNAVAQTDPHAIGCGSTVTNVSLDEALIRDDAAFAKTVELFETYFQNGGTHFQLTYVSREELLAAKATPDDYKNLRVRVTGFSDYFVKLRESIQDDIISRTSQK